jgi:hypothetical protein
MSPRTRASAIEVLNVDCHTFRTNSTNTCCGLGRHRVAREGNGNLRFARDRKANWLSSANLQVDLRESKSDKRSNKGVLSSELLVPTGHTELVVVRDVLIEECGASRTCALSQRAAA